jgi:hypothetical protein
MELFGKSVWRRVVIGVLKKYAVACPSNKGLAFPVAQQAVGVETGSAAGSGPSLRRNRIG